MINTSKSAIMFSANTPEATRRQITSILHISEVPEHAKYLGLPVVIGKAKVKAFDDLKHRIASKCQGWSEKKLSKAGKEVLIKAIVQAMPTYSMACFKLPDTLLRQIQGEIASFWWQSSGKRSIHWLGWEKLTIPKSLGGLGFRNFKAFNLAFLAKQAWRILTQPNLLLSQVYKSLYFPNTLFLEATKGHASSFSWKSIVEGKDSLQEGIKWRVGDGSLIKVWKDSWLPGLLRGKPFQRRGEVASSDDLTVACLIDHDTMSWRIDMLHQLFSVDEVDDILRIPLGWNRVDTPFWPYTQSGGYTVGSGSHFISQLWKSRSPGSSSAVESPLLDMRWQKLWALPIQNKIKHFIWRLCHNILPTPGNLAKKGVEVDTGCPLCHNEIADLLHIFIHCPIARQVWAMSNLYSFVKPFQVSSILSWVISVLSMQESEHIELFMILLWSLWTNRNGALFEGRIADPVSLVRVAWMGWREFRDANVRHSLAHQEASQVWVPPPQQWLKINVDAACRRDLGGGMGLVLRNDMGEFGWAHAMAKPGITDCRPLEAMAIQQACHWGIRLDMQQLIIESDAKYIVDLCVRQNEDRTYVGVIAQEICEMMQDREWFIQWVPRAGNEVAHMLASHVFAHQGEPPAFLIPMLLGDC